MVIWTSLDLVKRPEHGHLLRHLTIPHHPKMSSKPALRQGLRVFSCSVRSRGGFHLFRQDAVRFSESSASGFPAEEEDVTHDASSRPTPWLVGGFVRRVFSSSGRPQAAADFPRSRCQTAWQSPALANLVTKAFRRRCSFMNSRNSAWKDADRACWSYASRKSTICRQVAS